MAKVIRFPTNYPARQWEIRLKIEGLLDKLGWDMARCMMGFSADAADRWPLLDNESLLLMVDYLQEEYMLAQCTPKQTAAMPHAEAAPAQQTDSRPARLIAFPLTPEIEARQKACTGHACPPAVTAAKPKKTGAAKAEKQERQAAGKPDGKAQLIRKIKMVQRDCEKALPEFSDYTYRAILQERFNAGSSKELDNLQLINLLLYLKSLLTGNHGGGKPTVDAPALLYSDVSGLSRCGSMRKIQALLSEKGTAEGKYIRWSYALGILKRQTKGVVAEWENATPRQLDAVIAALSRDAERKGRRAK